MATGVNSFWSVECVNTQSVRVIWLAFIGNIIHMRSPFSYCILSEAVRQRLLA